MLQFQCYFVKLSKLGFSEASYLEGDRIRSSSHQSTVKSFFFLLQFIWFTYLA